MSKHVAKKLEKQRKRAERAAQAQNAHRGKGGAGDKNHASHRGGRAKPAGDKSRGGHGARGHATGGGPCPIARACGGCALIAQPYAQQLARKQTAMEKLYAPFAERFGCEVQPIAGMEKPLGYRHKAATPFAPGPRGSVLCGFYAAGTHRIVPCTNCPVEAPGARAILNGVARAAEELGIRAYNEDTHRGLLRHAVLRMGWRTHEALLTLVTNGQDLPHREELAARLMELDPRIVGVAHNVNQRPGNAILGPETHMLAGAPRMRDKLLSCTFEISPTAFYQTNPAQTEVLYSLAIDGCGLCDGDRVVDAYCGSGTIGICAAAAAREAGGRIRLTGIERTEAAIEDARKNAEINGVDEDSAFVAEDATQAMRRAAREGERADVVIMDPPRAGATEAFLVSAAALEPRRIVYVSCNPETQVRDFDVLVAHGYRPARVTPVDMFPHTEHVETVAVLERA